jgi:hypothetical protein
MSTSYGSGTIFQRGGIWYVAYWVDGCQIQKSSKSTKRNDAVKLRDRIIGKKTRGELGNALAEKITCGQLLDEVLEHVEANAKPGTSKIWKLVIGNRRVTSLTTDILKDYRNKRKAAGRSEATSNRELSILRTALNLGRKCTPPKVIVIPYFPMVKETNVRQGFLSDDEYAKLRDALPDAAAYL